MRLKIRCGIIKDYKDWIKPKIVENALDLLEKEIPIHKKKIDFVHLCFSTDPFMYRQKEVRNLSLKIIKRLNRDSIRCSVLTKGTYPKELVNTQKYGKNNLYGITLVSLNKDFKQKFEPFSASFESRIKNLKFLHDRGLKTWISMEPYPTPNLAEQDLLKILKEISFVDKIIFGKFNYNMKSSQFDTIGDFYQDCAETLIGFCENNGIDYHIKYGTQKRDNRKTEKIFRKEKTIKEDEILLVPVWD